MSDYCKILIIDDEFIMRQGMKHLLDWEKEGFQIVGEASNGQEGLELIEQLSPHIILADIVMPVLNGMEFSKLVQKKYPQIQIIILSSYDNFEYVKSTLLNGAVDYILKPTLNPQDLLKVLKKAASRIPGMVLSRGNEINYEKLMERYILGFDTSLDTRLIETYFKDSCFRLFGTNIRQIFGGDKSYFSKVETQLKDFFFEHETNYQVLSFILNKEYLVYIINYKVSKEKQLTEELRKLVSDIAKSHNKTHFALTESISSLTQIKEMYEEEFILLAENYFYQKDNPLVGKKDLIMGGYSLKKFDFLLYSSYLSNKQFLEAITLLKEYIDAAVEAKTDPYKLKNLTKNLIYNMILPLEQMYSNMDDLRQDYFYKIDDTYYVSEFIEVFHRFVASLQELLSQKQNVQNDRIQEMLSYIMEHSSESLDLMEVAKVFNFNYSYLSSYFNSHIQEGFSEYLNKIRVDKACVLLKQTPLSIAEISERVGYSDQSYFCRVFKKLTGYTPSSYRRRYYTTGGSL